MMTVRSRESRAVEGMRVRSNSPALVQLIQHALKTKLQEARSRGEKDGMVGRRGSRVVDCLLLFLDLQQSLCNE